MSLTVLGIALLPLVLRFAADGERLLQLVVIAAVFEGGAAAVFGGFGIQLGLLPALAFVTHLAAQYLLGMRYPGEASVLRMSTPLVLFLAYAAATAMVLPGVFAGQITVWPQKPDILFPEPVLLAPGGGNLTQTIYLTLNLTLCIGTALYLTRRSVRIWQRLVVAYMASGYLVAGIAIWQFGARVAGLPFPNQMLFSNPSWVVVEQSLGPIPRIQGPFTEPSGLAFYMAGLAFSCLWLCLRGHRVMHPQLLLMLAVVATCLSTSTTGIATLVIGLPAALILAAACGDAPGLRRASVTLGAMAGVAALVLVPLFLLWPELLGFVDLVIGATLEKSDSDSFVERQMWDGLAWNALLQSGGLGIGWGSTRSSSLLPGLLAGGGVVSALAIAWFAYTIARTVRRSRDRGLGRHPANLTVDSFIGAMIGQLLAALISAPTIVTPIFYLQLGAVIGGLVRFGIDSGRLRQSPAAAQAEHGAISRAPAG
ncbi:hypothetical protein [Belnapia rosea]|uniref:hypothetical protein n=1 Tax=Belnapia rosea TaxID=938405 RepID=UPI00088BB2DE|nr:hypothetical protein [Belnapia rosea]SDB28491.1 hypothetical protein SAMN02927895_00947 [Belnapia rosea]